MSTNSHARLAIVQYPMRAIANFQAFADYCRHLVETAAEYNADFIMFPEYFTTQLLSFIEEKDCLKSAHELAKLSDKYVSLFSNLARHHKINVIAGSTLVQDNDRLYNVAHFFDRTGELRTQHKIHITPNERRVWNVSGGDKVQIFDTDRGKVAILICYDIEFPELSRIATHLGAQIIFVPFNTDQLSGYLRVRYCAQARCIENHVYVAISGCTGNLIGATNASIHYAQSAIFSPCDFGFPRDGIVAEALPNIETMIIEDIDLSLLPKHREGGSVRNWNDRRLDCYQIRYDESFCLMLWS